MPPTPFSKNKTPETKEISKAEPMPDRSMFEAHAGAGLEGVTAKHMQLPFFTMLQTNSPQVVEGNSKRIEDAVAGQVLDTVRGVVYEARESKKTHLTVIPVHHRELFAEWIPREKGGGFVAHHDSEEILKQTHKGTGKDEKKDFLPNGNEIKRTHYWAVMLVEADSSLVAGMIAMTSTQLKISRKWVTILNTDKMKRADGSSFTAPMCSHTWKLMTAPEPKGEHVYFNWKFERLALVEDKNVFDESIAYTKMSGSASAAALPGGPEQAVLGEGEESPI